MRWSKWKGEHLVHKNGILILNDMIEGFNPDHRGLMCSYIERLWLPLGDKDAPMTLQTVPQFLVL